MADSTALVPTKDNSLFSESGDESGGGQEFLFSGRLVFAAPDVRRALLAFDVASEIPAGSTINSATLTLHVSTSPFPNTNEQPFALHRLLADWGETGSGAGVGGGGGVGAEPGDATWTCRFWDSPEVCNPAWTTAGGDFAALASASTIVPWTGDGYANWGSTAGMVADVQSWLDSPATNFGWIVIGDETVDGTARRFDSRQNMVDEAYHPLLTIDYTPPVGGPAGAVPNEDDVPGDPLRLAKLPAGVLALSWGHSCLATDFDYEVYEGLQGSFSSHTPVFCSTSGATTASLTPMPASAYYLVVPRNASFEGSYGKKTPGIERGPGGVSCLPQSLLGCP